MLVLTAVSSILHHRLQTSTSVPFRFIHAESWHDAFNAIRRQPIEIAMLEPALETEPRAHEVERFRVLFPSIPVVLYTTLSPEIAPTLLRLGQSGVKRVLVAWHDDHPHKIREALFSEAAQAVSHLLLSELADALSTLPDRLGWAIETIVREPAEMQSVQALADRAEIDRRTCHRWFARANLPTPSIMLTVLRVVYAHRLLQDPGYTIEDVATKLGYAQTRTLAQNVKEVFGVTPGELRVSLSPEEAISLVRDRYLRTDGKLASAS